MVHTSLVCFRTRTWHWLMDLVHQDLRLGVNIDLMAHSSVVWKVLHSKLNIFMKGETGWWESAWMWSHMSNEFMFYMVIKNLRKCGTWCASEQNLRAAGMCSYASTEEPMNEKYKFSGAIMCEETSMWVLWTLAVKRAELLRLLNLSLYIGSHRQISCLWCST